MIGTWSPAARGDSPQAFVKAAISITDNPATDQRERALTASSLVAFPTKRDKLRGIGIVGSTSVLGAAD
jgi:hypothetical protein